MSEFQTCVPDFLGNLGSFKYDARRLERARREDASYFVAFGRRDSDDAAFFATRPKSSIDSNGNCAESRSLNAGLGEPRNRLWPWTLMRPMSRHFVEIHGVDVSMK